MGSDRHAGHRGQHGGRALKRGLLAVAFSLSLALAAPAFGQGPQPAQSADAPVAASCQAEEVELERDIDLARSRGQMLRRRQLAESLAALRARCHPSDPSLTRAARIEKLEHDIRQLRAELEHAEEQLRELKSERP